MNKLLFLFLLGRFAYEPQDVIADNIVDDGDNVVDGADNVVDG